MAETVDHLAELLKRIEESKRKRDAESAAAAEKLKSEPEISETTIVLEPKIHTRKSKKRKKSNIESDNVEKDIDANNDANNKDNNINNLPVSNEIPAKNQEDFTVLGPKKKTKYQSVKRVLPSWLKEPEIISSELNDGPSLEEAKSILNINLVNKLEADGFKKLFPVQERILSWLISCDELYKTGWWVRDTCVSMPTGSGKTLAYVLPIVQLLQSNFVRAVRCLIVLPVQELALQVYEVTAKYCRNTNLRVSLSSGAHSFEEEQEKLVQKTEKGTYISLVDILITTPGRLIDHIKKTEGFSLSTLRFLVIDEADRSNEWLQYIPFPHSKPPMLTIENLRQSSNMPAQKILLSATLSQDPEKISRLGLFRPILFTSANVNLEMLDKDLNLDEKNEMNCFKNFGNPNELDEKVIECPAQYKPLALYWLLTQNKKIKKTLVFTNSCEATHRLALLMQSLFKEKDVAVAEISAHLGSKDREKTLEKFVQGTVQVLISSDALARGLDIPGVKQVVSYDLPKHIKNYIHRSGRTGRGGNFGVAVSIITKEQDQIFTKMLNKVGRKIPNIEKENFEELAENLNYQQYLDQLREKLSNEQSQNLKNLRGEKRKKIGLKR